MMDGMFDHDHDGKLSARERMERDYFITEVTGHSDRRPQPHGNSDPGKAGAKLLGVLFLIIGISAFIYFPVFALIMIALAVYCFTR